MKEPRLELTKKEAHALIERIHSCIQDARVLVLELYEKRGWKALGYGNWRECVIAEFGKSKSRLYQLLDAAKVERNISTIVEKSGAIPEGVLRPLSQLDPEDQREVWRRVTAIPGEHHHPNAKE
jgi:hypothetical protein